MQAYADSARVLQEQLVRDEPNHVDQSQHLAKQLALGGHTVEAVKEGERALALALARGDQALSRTSAIGWRVCM